MVSSRCKGSLPPVGRYRVLLYPLLPNRGRHWSTSMLRPSTMVRTTGPMFGDYSNGTVGSCDHGLLAVPGRFPVGSSPFVRPSFWSGRSKVPLSFRGLCTSVYSVGTTHSSLERDVSRSSSTWGEEVLRLSESVHVTSQVQCSFPRYHSYLPLSIRTTHLPSSSPPLPTRFTPTSVVRHRLDTSRTSSLRQDLTVLYTTPVCPPPCH